jgi:hypothetical protein
MPTQEDIDRMKEKLHTLMEKRDAGVLTENDLIEFMFTSRDTLMAVSKPFPTTEENQSNTYWYPSGAGILTCSCGAREDSCKECVSWDGTTKYTSEFVLNAKTFDIYRFQLKKDVRT